MGHGRDARRRRARAGRFRNRARSSRDASTATSLLVERGGDRVARLLPPPVRPAARRGATAVRRWGRSTSSRAASSCWSASRATPSGAGWTGLAACPSRRPHRLRLRRRRRALVAPADTTLARRRALRRRRTRVRAHRRAGGPRRRRVRVRPRRRLQHGRVRRRAWPPSGRDADEIEACCAEELVRRSPFNDYTFPRVALIRSRKAAAMLDRVFGDHAGRGAGAAALHGQRRPPREPRRRAPARTGARGGRSEHVDPRPRPAGAARRQRCSSTAAC